MPIGPRLKRGGVIAVLRPEPFEPCEESESSFLGTVAYVLASAWDKRRSDAVLALRNRALEALDQGVMITDAQRIGEPLIYVNPAFEALTGYPAAEALGRNPAFLHGEETDPTTVQALGIALRTGHSFRATLVNYRRDKNPFWNDLDVSPIFDAEGRISHHVGVMSDATERLRLEAQFRQAQKMEAIGHLTGGIAHDFNNILAVILGNCEIILDDISDPQLRQVAELAIKAAERGALLTERLLAFGRRQALQPEPVNLAQSISSLTDMLKRTLGEQIDVVTCDTCPDATALVDRPLFESALINLAINARDAMPEGGTLTISARRAETLDHASPSKSVDPGFLRVSVADTGTGMSEEVRGKAFEPFFTTKTIGRGSGLGLAMVYGFVKQSGGHVFIESETGRGTTVHLDLPMAATRPQAAPKLSRKMSTEVSTGCERILLVEDELEVRRFVSRVLGRLGYSVIEADNAPSALAVLRNGDSIDLLFSDLILPGGMNGLGLVEEARRMRPGLRVLLTTGYTEEYERLAEDAPARILRKPYRREELATTLRAVLEAA
ncbi:ATP-binding protein [Jiella mangrovi]|uniref:histidine kinase n=1 Tax=Jiella mangrovi TaxID=2821407 RepID=A0ABS4BJ58_9HYPH|nr:ATP-binding protein [Jiella mangrovi]MBP0616809.1 PAS domain-containing protein [Jiella mangrovi]